MKIKLPSPRKIFTSRRRIASFILIFLIITSSSLFLYVKFAYGTTRTWDGGGGDNFWNDCTNWSADSCPGTLDVAAFDGTSSKPAEISAAVDVGGINIGAAYGGTITQDSGITINVRALDFIQAGGTFVGGDSTIAIGAGNVTISGGSFTNTSSTLTWTISGTSKAFNITGSTFSNPGTVKFADASLSTETLTCSGTFPGTVDIAQTSGNATFSLSSSCAITLPSSITTNGTITNGGTINATDINITDQINGNTPNFNQNGTLNMTGTLKFTSTHSGSQTLTCSGNLTASGGVVDISQTSTGAFILSSGCNITLTASVSTSAPITNNGTMTATTLTLASTNNFTNNGTLSATTVSLTFGNFTQAPGANFSSGTLKFSANSGLGTQTLTCTGNLSSSGGIVDDAQTSTAAFFVISSGCSVTFVSSVSTTSSITNNGTLNATNITFKGAGFTQNGILNLSGTFTIDGSNLTQTLTCAGIFPGTVDDTSGNTANIFVISSGCAVNFASTISTSGSITNNGKVSATNITLNHGDFTQNGTLNLSGTLTFTGINSTQTLTCSGLFPGTVDDTSGNTANIFVISSGCAVNFASAVSTSGSVTINGAGTGTNLTVGNSFTLGSGGTLSLSGSLTFNTSTASTLTCNNRNLNTSVVVSKTSSGNTWVLGSDCTVAGFNFTQGTISNPTSRQTLSVTGDFTESATTVFGGSGLTLQFTGSGTQNISKTAGALSTPINVNKTGGVAQLSANFSTSAAATVSAGTLFINGNTFSTAQNLTVNSGGNLQLFGNETVPAPTLNTGSTVTYTGTSGSNSYTLKSWSYYNIAFNQTAGTNTFNLAATTTIPGSVIIGAGTLDAVSGSNFNLTVGGNWFNTGTFTPRSATVTFNDNSQSSLISGTTTFNNLTSTTANKRLLFAAGSTQTVSSALTLTGTNGQYISLTSKTPGTQWNIVSNGTASLSYLEVKDSNACGGTTLVPTNSVNLGNDSCWTLPASSSTHDIKINRGIHINQGTVIKGI